MTYKDVFIQDINNKNIFYFLFVFDRNRIFNINEDRFILGMKFCEKFQFEFSNDKKLITHYVKIEEELDKESKSIEKRWQLLKPVKMLIQNLRF